MVMRVLRTLHVYVRGHPLESLTEKGCGREECECFNEGMKSGKCFVPLCARVYHLVCLSVSAFLLGYIDVLNGIRSAGISPCHLC